MIQKEQIQEQFADLQLDIATKIAAIDGKSSFVPDHWVRAEGGGGTASVLIEGRILEKAGVNFSAVWGETPTKILDKLNLEKAAFYGTGVSIVMHPFNPMVPIIHMNIRYFEMSNGTWWFGGGIDLTPHYVNDADAVFFHQALKTTCDKFDLSFYPKFKTWADDYFYITHRNETRGVGGIFFDHLNEKSGYTKNQLFEFVLSIGKTFAPTYSELLLRNHKKQFSESNKKWQLLRRGRYVEFNLVLDRGTKFGLDTNGRTESILMSLPPQANWIYDFKTELGSEEERTLSLLKKGITWI